jgi:hypothetical protein
MWESTDSYISLTLLGRGRKRAGQFEFRGRYSKKGDGRTPPP